MIVQLLKHQLLLIPGEGDKASSPMDEKDGRPVDEPEQKLEAEKGESADVGQPAADFIGKIQVPGGDRFRPVRGKDLIAQCKQDLFLARRKGFTFQKCLQYEF